VPEPDCQLVGAYLPHQLRVVLRQAIRRCFELCGAFTAWGLSGMHAASWLFAVKAQKQERMLSCSMHPFGRFTSGCSRDKGWSRRNVHVSHEPLDRQGVLDARISTYDSSVAEPKLSHWAVWER
jgi:hypothetical protein